MGHYLIETTHTPEQCLADLDTVLEQSPGLLQKLEWGCRTGVHMGWAVVEPRTPQTPAGRSPQACVPVRGSWASSGSPRTRSGPCT